jgi:plasmid stabilization system protein ParE
MVKRRITIIWDNLAIIHLTAIYNYYYPLSPKSANKIRIEILNAVSQLSVYPESGVYDELYNARYLVVWHWRIYYLYDNSRVAILKIFDMRQNPNNFEL